MTSRKETALILGGTGKSGSRVARRLRARGIETRVGSRSGNPPFDWNDPRTFAATLAGVSSVYITYFPDLAAPGASEAISALVEAAITSGARRLVLLSGRGEPQVLPSERAVRESRLAWTIIRGAFFAQNFSEGHFAEPIRSGEFAFPGATAGEPFVDLEDVADIATLALTSDAHAGQVYDVTGPRLLTFAEAVLEIAQASGRTIRYVPVTPAEYGGALRGILPDEQIDFLVELFSGLLDGHNAHVTHDVERVLGRQARDFSDFVREAARAGAFAER